MLDMFSEFADVGQARSSKKRSRAFAAMMGVVGISCGMLANAADWSDTSIGWRYGTKFAEPYNTADISKTITTPTKAASGKWLQNPSLSLSRLISNIITTNKNNTITAPTYTSTNTIAKNSAFNSSQRQAALKNANTKNSAACTGLRAVITCVAANINMAENT